MAMSLLKKIDDYSVGGLNIDSSNILLNMGKPNEVTGRLDSRAGDAKFIKSSGEEVHGSSWSGAERIGLDIIRDEFENIYSINEFVKDRAILTEKFPIGVYITENFRLTARLTSGMRSSG